MPIHTKRSEEEKSGGVQEEINKKKKQHILFGTFSKIKILH